MFNGFNGLNRLNFRCAQLCNKKHTPYPLSSLLSPVSLLSSFVCLVLYCMFKQKKCGEKIAKEKGEKDGGKIGQENGKRAKGKTGDEKKEKGARAPLKKRQDTDAVCHERKI